MSETEFKKVLRNALGGWSRNVEHGRGGATGICDILFLNGSLLLPIECKLGEWKIGEEVRLIPSEVRPDQIQFMSSLYDAGGDCRLIIGVRNKKEWDAWSLQKCNFDTLTLWRFGWSRSQLVKVMSKNKMTFSISS